MRSVVICFLITIVISSAAVAQAPDLLSFQGYVTDSVGTPINHPGIPIRFRLTDVSAPVWLETQPSVKIVDGVFNVRLGSVVPLDTVRFNKPLLLRIKVGSDPEIQPHTSLAAAAYAKALPGLYTFYQENGDRKSYNVVGGAANNVVGAGVTGATIGGGGGELNLINPVRNRVLHDWGTVGGGGNNTASGRFATVSGGSSNGATGGNSTIGGGFFNAAVDSSSTIGGGGGNTASGSFATVPGGTENSAGGNASFAAGRGAKAIHGGTFVWSDRSITSGNDSLLSTAPNQFLIRAAGGVGIGTNAPASQLHVAGGVTISKSGDGAVLLNLRSERSWEFRQLGTDAATTLELASVSGGGNKNFVISTGGNVGIRTTTPAHPLQVGTDGTNGNGAHVTDGGTWTSTSSREVKERFKPVDTSEVLQLVAGLPIQRWHYKGSDEGEHLGAMAEDFRGAFGLGSTEKTISMVDADGVALAAIQGLYELVQTQQVEIERMRAAMARAGIE